MNYIYICLLIAMGLGGVIWFLRKRAENIALEILHKSASFLVEELESNAVTIVEFLVARLPLSARIFLPNSVVERLVNGILGLIRK